MNNLINIILDIISSEENRNIIIERFNPSLTKTGTIIVCDSIFLNTLLDDEFYEVEYSDYVDKDVIRFFENPNVKNKYFVDKEVPSTKKERLSEILTFNLLTFNKNANYFEMDNYPYLKEFNNFRRKVLNTLHLSKDEFLALLVESNDLTAIKLCKDIIDLTSLERFIDIYPKYNKKVDEDILRNAFELLCDETKFNSFINKDLKTYKGVNKEEYVILLANLLGSPGIDVDRENSMIFEFTFITENMINKYLYLRNLYNVDLEVLRRDTTQSFFVHKKSEQEFIDNNWTLDSKLEEEIFRGIDPDYTLVEKLAFIYIKVCLIIGYNGIYSLFNNDMTEYVKENQEKISLDFPFAMCSEVARIFTKLFNCLDKSISARCCNPFDAYHEFCIVLIPSKDIMVQLDAALNNEGYNDMFRAKMGMPINGITYLADRNNEFKDAVDKVYSDLKKKRFINDKNMYEFFLEKYENTYLKQEDRIKLFLKFSSENRIVNTELAEFFIFLYNRRYFGDINFSIVGVGTGLKTRDVNNIQRSMIINMNGMYYYLDLYSYNFHKVSLEYINKMFEEGNMIYQNNHVIRGIGGKR